MRFPQITISAIKARYNIPRFSLPLGTKNELFKSEYLLQDLEELENMLAEKFYAFLLENIKTNRYNFKLKPQTEKKKGNWVGSVPWIDTRTLIQGLIVDGSVVGFIDAKYPGRNLDYDQLAMILEYGVKERGVPPRDVFRRSFRDFQPMVEELILKYLDPLVY